jgi:hypothetical protein
LKPQNIAMMEAVTILAWMPTPKRVPPTPGEVSSMYATARAAAPVPMARSS